MYSHTQGFVPMDFPGHIASPDAMATSDMDIVVQKLISFLSRTKQVLSILL